MQDGIAASCAGERFFRDAPNFAVGHDVRTNRTPARGVVSDAKPRPTIATGVDRGYGLVQSI